MVLKAFLGKEETITAKGVGDSDHDNGKFCLLAGNVMDRAVM